MTPPPEFAELDRRVRRLERRTRWLWAALAVAVLLSLALGWGLYVFTASQADNQAHLNGSIYKRLERLEEGR